MASDRTLNLPRLVSSRLVLWPRRAKRIRNLTALRTPCTEGPGLLVIRRPLTPLVGRRITWRDPPVPAGKRREIGMQPDARSSLRSIRSRRSLGAVCRWALVSGVLPFRSQYSVTCPATFIRSLAGGAQPVQAARSFSSRISPSRWRRRSERSWTERSVFLRARAGRDGFHRICAVCSPIAWTRTRFSSS